MEYRSTHLVKNKHVESGGKLNNEWWEIAFFYFFLEIMCCYNINQKWQVQEAEEFSQPLLAKGEKQKEEAHGEVEGGKKLLKR